MIDGLGPHHERALSREGPTRPRRAAALLPLARWSHALVEIVKDLDEASRARAIHQLRTTIRRVEALVAAAPEPSPDDRKMLRQLDRIRKHAGKVRDVDVHLKAVRGLPRALAAAGRDELAADLRKARRKRQKRLLRTIGEARDQSLVKRLRRAAAGATGAARADELAVHRALAGVLADFAFLYAASTPLRASNLHRFRIGAKTLRYRAESFAPHPLADAIVTEIERAQDAIGTWHDWVTLGARARKTLGDDHVALRTALMARVESSRARAIAVSARVAGRLGRMTVVGVRKGVRRVASPAGAAPAGVRLGTRAPA